MSILVLGGTGMVGTLVTERLLALGLHADVATREPAHARALPNGARAVRFQFEHARAEDFAGHERVFCLVPRGVTLSPEAGASFFEATVEARVARVVLMTGLGVDRAVGSMLHQLERALVASGLAHAIVRPNYVLQSFCAGPLRESLVRRSEIVVPVGDASISFVDARDVAEVAVAMLRDDRSPASALDLTGPAAITYAEIAEAMTETLGRPIHVRTLSEDDARDELARAGMARQAIETRLGLLSLARRGAFAEVTSDALRVLGHAPRTMRAFVHDYAASWREETSE